MVGYRIIPSELKHHGIIGQKWGIRRTKEELGYKVHLKSGEMDMDEYLYVCELWKKIPEYKNITNREKEYVYEELDNNLSASEKLSAIVSRRIDDYFYTALNKGHNQYKIINKVYKGSTGNWDKFLDSIFTEIVGQDWRDYDY